MLALRNFLQFGVIWAGDLEDVQFLDGRAARVLLYSLADQTNVRNPIGGIKKSRPALTGHLYQKSSVSATLKRLLVLGLLTRERGDRRGSPCEEFASTAIVTVLVDAALQWQKHCQQLKKDGKRAEHARPAKTTLVIPLKSTPTPGEPSLARAAEDQHPITGPISVQKLETVSVFTPPLQITGSLAPVHPPRPQGSGGPVDPVLPTPLARGGREVPAGSAPHGGGRPFFQNVDVFNFRNFTGWLLAINKDDTLTSVVLIRPSERGRLEVFKRHTSTKGQMGCGLTSVDPVKLFKLAYARSKDVFQRCGEGEQVFLAPRPGSRVILLDDLKSAAPVFPDTPCAILETSHANYQHFYVCDRPLTVDEQGQMQSALASRFCADHGATGGGQPHRCPGSVNYKKGRDLFTTQLTYLTTAGRPLPFTSLPVAPHSKAPALLRNIVDHKPINKMDTTSSASDQSAADWAWVKANINLGRESLIAVLGKRSVARGKHHDYARRTVEKALSS